MNLPLADVSETVLLVNLLKKTRPEDFEAIVRHQNALTEVLIECWVDGLMGHDQHRVYEVKRSFAGCYNSRMSGGQEHWTKEPKGPDGEPIVRWREWVMLEKGYIASFMAMWEVAVFVLHQMRGKNVFVVSDAVVFPEPGSPEED